MKYKTPIYILMVFLAAGCSSLTTKDANEGPIQASGIVETVQVNVASEFGGRVVEVFSGEGDAVSAGDPLFRLADDLLSAQRNQVLAARDTAESNLALAEAQLASASAAQDAAETSLALASLQLEQVVSAARLQEQPLREAAWAQALPEDFDRPAWYYQKHEMQEAAAAEMQLAAEELESARAAYATVLAEPYMPGLNLAESRLAAAQAAYAIAQELLQREAASNESDGISAAVQDLFDSARADLETAQSEFNSLLSEQEVNDVLEIRARLAVAQARFDLARDLYDSLRTGEDSLAVQAARLGVSQARIAQDQAAAALAQAQAAVALAQDTIAETNAALAALDVQQSKLTVTAPVSGVVLMRGVEPGEIVVPGAAAFTIGKLDALTITVFVPENRYGRISLQDTAEVQVDSFSGETFNAVVTRIANEAEFTPRNVQTQEERVTTVFAIRLEVTDPDGRLKPGMPADVTFSGSD